MSARIRTYLIDDHNAVREAVATMIAAAEDIDVVGQSADVHDGIAEVVRLAPHVVLLDLKLPRLNGIDVLRRLKSDDRQKSIPVVMLTSSNEERDIVESYALGVNSYLIKPVEFDKLGEQVVNAGLYWLLANKVPG